ncbi:MAG TPA: hypothetical protein VK172_10205 [Lentimicrobium sp.]|nr:hypothetical protein [Lentimicrobium sp.]
MKSESNADQVFDLNTLTTKEIELMNREIGIFLGWKVIVESNGGNDYWCSAKTPKNQSTAYAFSFGERFGIKTEKGARRRMWETLYGMVFNYHKKLDSLFEAVDKIETLTNGIEGMYGDGDIPLMVRIEGLEDRTHKCSIILNQHSKFMAVAVKREVAVFKAVYDFAKWYNKMKAEWNKDTQ